MRGSLLFLAVFTVGSLSAIASACGSSGDSTFDNGMGDASDDVSQGPGPGFDPDATTMGMTCVPTTCTKLAVGCGKQSDGCGGVLDCGGCTAPTTCGGGGAPSVCGGTFGCVAKTCAQLAVGCGKQGDGCGGVVDCGGCAAPAYCGGGGPSTCGGGSAITTDGAVCVPTGCPVTPTCGPVADGCGGLTINCGTCTMPQFCGGGAGPSTCGIGALPDGGVICTPKTCAAFPAGTCGAQADGCGGLTPDCLPGGCGGGKICGLITPSKCDGYDAALPCTGLCLSQVNTCDAATPTTLKGTVYAPDGVEPMYGALVYVANCALSAFTPNVSCDQCGAAASGCPLVQATTDYDGKFTLTNVPAATSYPLVIQLGRWRRQVTIAAQAACTTVDLNTVAGKKQTHFPTMSTASTGAGGPCAAAFAAATDKTDVGDIPLTAIATGDYDALECVLRKVGINDCEFTNPSATGGRMRFYKANGSTISGTTPSWTTLSGDINELKKYDIVLLPCEGGADPLVTPVDAGAATATTSTWQQNLVDYTTAGGRAYATHYSYTWLSNIASGTTGGAGPTPFASTGVWNIDQTAEPGSVTGDIDTTLPDGGVFTKGSSFASWLGQPSVNALSNVSPPKILLSVSRHDIDAVNNPPAQRWIKVDPTLPGGGSAMYPGVPQHMTFNTPVPPADGGVVNQCGRVLYSDFHVNTGRGGGKTFPSECGGPSPYTPQPLTPQEKVLEFMLFDLASCVAPVVPPPPPVCIPKNCAAMGITCGPSGDGCGNVIAGGCGTCDGGTCGGGGTPGVCGSVACTPTTCAAKGATCGFVPNGCGGSINCGVCDGGTCGGGGVPGTCGGGTCTVTTCAAAGALCGPLGDGCGNLLDCGPCPPGDSCFANKCVTPSCTPRTCFSAGANCGPVSDGCGNLLDCGACVAPQSCGGGGVSNQCGGGIK